MTVKGFGGVWRLGSKPLGWRLWLRALNLGFRVQRLSLVKGSAAVCYLRSRVQGLISACPCCFNDVGSLPDNSCWL